MLRAEGEILTVPEVTATDFSGDPVHSPQGAEPWLIDTCRCLQSLGWLGTTGCHCCPTQVLPMGLFLGSRQVAPAKKMPSLKQEWKQQKRRRRTLLIFPKQHLKEKVELQETECEFCSQFIASPRVTWACFLGARSSMRAAALWKVTCAKLAHAERGTGCIPVSSVLLLNVWAWETKKVAKHGLWYTVTHPRNSRADLQQ